jgi:transcriptional regulator of acetoin/glycerol metabolism
MTGTRPVLPVETGGTLILEEGDRLNECDQADLLGWLSDRGRSVCVFTTSARSLYPLVDAGLFLEALYYRLNHRLIEVGSFPG